MNANQALIDSLKELVGFLEERPDHPVINDTASNTMIPVFFNSREKLMAAITGCGQLEKMARDDTFQFRKKFGSGIMISYIVSRDLVCKKIVTTTIKPATPEQVIPAQPEREVEVVTWECPESVLRKEVMAADLDVEDAPVDLEELDLPY